MAAGAVGGNRRKKADAPIARAEPTVDICLELEDHGEVRHSAVELFRLKNLRDPHSRAARLADQFILRNRSLLRTIDVTARTEFDGREVSLFLQSGSGVGAIPLYSPTTARPDYGIVVQPRFPWKGIGPMLAEMGWRVAPSPLRLPLLRRSERRVPSWVLSSMVLVRMNALLDTLDRRFELSSEDLRAPRGRVDWGTYATNRVSRANLLSIPCSFPDLRDDRRLKGAVRYVVEKQLRSLDTQRQHGSFVHRLIDLGRSIFRRVQDVPVVVPVRGAVDAWLQRPLRNSHFLDGIQAIHWTIDDRGLAGVSDLEGIPWQMPMEQFFEAWVETVLARVSQQTGGNLKSGRRRETVHSVNWRPPFTGSQRSLIPDFLINYQGVTIIVDAKYKRHWEELQRASWAKVEEELREQHRNDLFQILAYSSLATERNVVACLAYPCSTENWERFRELRRLHHKAEIPVGNRMVRIWLTAIPMSRSADSVAAPLIQEIHEVLSSIR